MQQNRFPVIATGALILNEGGAVFLAQAAKWGERWIIPGGKVQYGETILDALRREVNEETGLSIICAEFLRVGESIQDPAFLDGQRHLILLDFVCSQFEGAVELDGREFTRYQWVSPREALGLPLGPSTREAIEYYLCEKGLHPPETAFILNGRSVVDAQWAECRLSRICDFDVRAEVTHAMGVFRLASRIGSPHLFLHRPQDPKDVLWHLQSARVDGGSVSLANSAVIALGFDIA